LDPLSLILKTCKSLFEHSDGVLKIVSAPRQRPGEDRIGGVERIRHPRAFPFGGNVAVQDLDYAIKVNIIVLILAASRQAVSLAISK
jgi:hypothetical protein